MKIYKKNLKKFESRISGNLYNDKKSSIKRRRDSIMENNCVDGEWVFEQYKKQNGICANPRCNYKLNKILEEEEIMGCWRVTSVNRINNNIGHIKSNCNLMHSFCNSAMEWNDFPSYLFKCKRNNCACYENCKKVFEKIGHPENIENNRNRMKAVRKGFVYKEKKKKRKKYFNNKYQLLILENKYWRVMRQLRYKVKQKKALIKKRQKMKSAIEKIIEKLKETKKKKNGIKKILEKIVKLNG